jgi:hypothetical protein
MYCDAIIDDECEDSDDDYDYDEEDDFTAEERHELDFFSSALDEDLQNLASMPSVSGDGRIFMPAAFESEQDVQEMTLLDQVMANSSSQFLPPELRPNQYGACHGEAPSERTVRRHSQHERKKDDEAKGCFKISHFFRPGKNVYIYACTLVFIFILLGNAR